MASTSSNAEDQSQSALRESSDPIPTNSNRNGGHRRIFIGPMPEKVITHTESHGKKNRMTISSALSLTMMNRSTENHETRPGDKTEEISRILKDNAFRFFIHQGGDPGDWDEEEEQGLIEELLDRWKQSEWGQLWSRRHHRRKNDPQNTGTDSHWFGKSFEVGSVLGMNVMYGHEHIQTKSSPSNPPGPDKGLLKESIITSSVGQETFLTALNQTNLASPRPIASIQSQSLADLSSSDKGSSPPVSESSKTGLLKSQKTKLPLNTHFDAVTSSSTQVNGYPIPSSKGKSKMVHYDDAMHESVSTLGPVPANVVLDRTKSTVDLNTSLAATISPEYALNGVSGDLKWGDVILRDRMLVRVSYSKSENFSYFNDDLNRTTRDLHYEAWGEFLVAWRRDSIEIYKDHGTPGRERVTGRKHLSYVIPLRSKRTHLSLYSFVDMTFCITCPPTTTQLNPKSSRWMFSRDKDGTNIFIFKLKSRSRAFDWTWLLWQQMGGQIPKTVDVHVPGLSTKVTIDVPHSAQFDEPTMYNLFRRQNVVDLCMETVRNMPDWIYLIESQISKGKSLQLAWRVNASLDWIWLEKDVLENPRHWAVLCGLPFKQALRPPVLEIRLADHAPTHIHLKNGTRVDEPPSIEGYLDRIRPNSQTKQQIYLSTHNGNLFTLNTFSAFPPMPPGLASISTIYTDPQTFRQAEIHRGTNQIVTATGVCDLRTIVAVRRASHPAPPHTHELKETKNDEMDVLEECHSDDARDEGGEAGLSKFSDRTRVRIRRSFELMLNTGHVVRFEAHSCEAATEWIERLRALIFYWKVRHRMDANQEIELAQAQRPRLTPQTRLHFDDEHEMAPEAPLDFSAPSAAINSLYNWCVLEGCKPIVKAGRLYMRKGLRGQDKLVQLFLVAGHLVRFRVGRQSTLYQSMGKKINLLDAYVCSGYFAAQSLPEGKYMPNAPPAPRRYKDGLETDDREEDMLLMIWYRSQPQMANADQNPTLTPFPTKSVPKLSSNNNVLVLRTRSLFERDSWCWALNSEIEKIVRAQASRETQLRETGGLVKLEL